jgi:hypothetical protein
MTKALKVARMPRPLLGVWDFFHDIWDEIDHMPRRGAWRFALVRWAMMALFVAFWGALALLVAGLGLGLLVLIVVLIVDGGH